MFCTLHQVCRAIDYLKKTIHLIYVFIKFIHLKGFDIHNTK